MTFEQWWENQPDDTGNDETWFLVKALTGKAWNEAQRQLLLDLTNARIDAKDQMVLGEMQRVKNFKALA